MVTSNTSSLPEVAGDAAFYCNPSSEESIAEAMSACLAEPQRRGEKVREGIESAGGFTWRRSAEAMVAAMEEAAQAAL